jgi:hypothetical protein
MDADTCLEGAKTCHVNSQCVDFATGFCCECMEPFYGNGLNCLKPSMYYLLPVWICIPIFNVHNILTFIEVTTLLIKMRENTLNLYSQWRTPCQNW